MTEIHFNVMLPDAEMENGWPTKGAIDDEVAFARKELSTQLGAEIGDRGVTFSWGAAWSTFDPKGFQEALECAMPANPSFERTAYGGR